MFSRIKYIDSAGLTHQLSGKNSFSEYLIGRKKLEISKVSYSWAYLRIQTRFSAEEFGKKEQQKALWKVIVSVDLVCVCLASS